MCSGIYIIPIIVDSAGFVVVSVFVQDALVSHGIKDAAGRRVQMTSRVVGVERWARELVAFNQMARKVRWRVSLSYLSP